METITDYALIRRKYSLQQIFITSFSREKKYYNLDDIISRLNSEKYF